MYLYLTTKMYRSFEDEICNIVELVSCSNNVDCTNNNNCNENALDFYCNLHFFIRTCSSDGRLEISLVNL